MSRTQRKHAIVWLLCLALGGAACSTPEQKPDETQEQVAEKPEQSASKEVPPEVVDGQSDEQAQQEAEALPQADEPEEQAPERKPGEKIVIDSDFKSDLADALEAAKDGDRDAAVSELQSLADRRNGGFLAAFNLGVLYEHEGDYRKAAQRYSQALQKNPDFSPALLNLVRLYLRLDQPRDAEKLARKYTNDRPENMDHRAVALQVDLHEGKYEEVIRKAKQILRRDEKNVESMLAMAEANIQLERAELAEAILDRAHELRPERAEIYFKYAKIRSQEEKLSDAISLLEQALQKRVNFPEAHNNLGVLYHEAGDYNAAVKEFRAAIGDYPDFKEAYLNLGNSLKGLQKYKKAEKAFTKALEIDADYGDALFNLGVLYLDSDIEGIDKIAQLNKSIEYLTKYKNAAGGRIEKDDPAGKYIAEARKTIEVEKQRQEMMRQAQMQAEDDSGDESSESSDGSESADGQ
ncbi:tetratricopeptide repeat protein [Persicimonas caeni]|uniref:Tetratricopeptide repeat protein n=1 Tax=Persicimonas caeni TaxID=2292766 RepID=A0A4Y6PWM1_PERCE|nr:tetratricopeptide repeat protein [Persicimonas caeni]QDG52724.1 tetratricopeptide repeat protein [Persicimonas caeni]QED33946.1 tetratricopeptide repeat protein [Persicimonas caeni]